jgi:plastocyanin
MPRLAPAVLAVVLVAAVAPALAAQDYTITARQGPNRFDPPTLPINAGDRVIFANEGGTHNFVFEDGLRYPDEATAPGAAWNGLSRTFDAAGTYRYYCAQHGTLTTGMRGTITVTGNGGGSPTPTPSATATPSATPTPAPGASPTPGPSGGTPGAPAVRLRSVALAAGTFCARRGPGCKRPGVRLRIDLSAPARVTGVLRRRAKRFGRVDLGTVAAGPRTLRFQRTTSGKRLAPGRYALALSVDGVAAKTLRFRVR